MFHCCSCPLLRKLAGFDQSEYYPRVGPKAR
jgi:hypothetical protein